MATRKQGKPAAAKAETKAKTSAQVGPVVLKKISTAKVMGVKVRPPENGEPLDLYIVYGRASAVKRGTSDYGPWTALVGSFEAERCHDGKLFYSANALIPDVTEMVASSVESGDGSNMVEFAFKVSIIESDTAIGYEYSVSPLIKASGAEPLSDMRDQIKALTAQ